MAQAVADRDDSKLKKYLSFKSRQIFERHIRSLTNLREVLRTYFGRINTEKGEEIDFYFPVLEKAVSGARISRWSREITLRLGALDFPPHGEFADVLAAYGRDWEDTLGKPLRLAVKFHNESVEENLASVEGVFSAQRIGRDSKPILIPIRVQMAREEGVWKIDSILISQRQLQAFLGHPPPKEDEGEFFSLDGYLDLFRHRYETILALSEYQVRRSRMAANESSAVGTLRTINTACVIYSATYRRGFPPSLAALGPPANGRASAKAAELINSALVSGFKRGYRFAYVSRDFDGNGTMDGFTVNADPISRGTTGGRSFFIDQSHVIRWNGNGRAGSYSPPL